MTWEPIDKDPPRNTPLWALTKDRSMVQVLWIGQAFLTPKAGYQFARAQFTHWMIVPDLPPLAEAERTTP